MFQILTLLFLIVFMQKLNKCPSDSVQKYIRMHTQIMFKLQSGNFIFWNGIVFQALVKYVSAASI
jgi:hypothetical protein